MTHPGIVIGVAGGLNVGKNTVASMINYIHVVGISKARFNDWLIKDLKFNPRLKQRITHFADPLKESLSIMYNIPLEYFYDRDKKDNEWYSIKERRFIKPNTKDVTYKHIGITIEDLRMYHLAFIINDIVSKGNYPIITLRTLMQYFGTDLCRTNLGEDIWTNSAIYRIADIAESKGLCIVPDIRYSNENDVINNHFLYGGVIEVRRGKTNGNHSSEVIDFDTKFVIDNNNSKMALFYKVFNIYQQVWDGYNSRQ